MPYPKRIMERIARRIEGLFLMDQAIMSCVFIDAESMALFKEWMRRRRIEEKRFEEKKSLLHRTFSSDRCITQSQVMHPT